MSSKDPKFEVQIRGLHGPEEYPRLVEIWRSSVNATHDFLAKEHHDVIESQLAVNYFPQVDVYVAEHEGFPVGFAGVVGKNLEMLFVEACHRGQGIGSALMSFVLVKCEVATVEVNEQNTQAVEFYLHQGFSIVGRSPQDQQGWPYPILHLARNNENRRCGSEI